jgi:hypothetical protein
MSHCASKSVAICEHSGEPAQRAARRRRLYRLDPARLRSLHDWMARYEQITNERLDRMDDHLKQLERQGERQ